jgi:predicted RNA-binding protein YlqC (UPF0109 family)
MSTPYQDLTEVMAKAIVDEPEQVTVNAVRGSTSVMLELTVAGEDMGRVIGRRGKVANAMRTLLRCQAARAGKRVKLEIIEPEDEQDGLVKTE